MQCPLVAISYICVLQENKPANKMVLYMPAVFIQIVSKVLFGQLLVVRKL